MLLAAEGEGHWIIRPHPKMTVCLCDATLAVLQLADESCEIKTVRLNIHCRKDGDTLNAVKASGGGGVLMHTYPFVVMRLSTTRHDPFAPRQRHVMASPSHRRQDSCLQDALQHFSKSI